MVKIALDKLLRGLGQPTLAQDGAPRLRLVRPSGARGFRHQAASLDKNWRCCLLVLP